MGKLRLSGKERLRLEVLSKVRKSGISLGKAAELLEVSYRQVLRIWQRFVAEGGSGLKHGLRDRASNRQLDTACRERVLELYRVKYWDFGPTFALEHLRQDDGENLSKETFRLWLIEAGLWQARRRARCIANGGSGGLTGAS